MKFIKPAALAFSLLAFAAAGYANDASKSSSSGFSKA